MSEFFLEYGLFLAKTVTLVVAILVVVGFAVATSRKAREEGGMRVKSLNARYRDLTDAVRREVLPKKAMKAALKARKAEEKRAAVAGGSGGIAEPRPYSFVNQADAPSCMDCGSIMIRNGACYKCANCGSTSGCS